MKKNIVRILGFLFLAAILIFASACSQTTGGSSTSSGTSNSTDSGSGSGGSGSGGSGSGGSGSGGSGSGVSGGVDLSSLKGTAWKVTHLGGTEIPASDEAYLLFNTDVDTKKEVFLAYKGAPTLTEGAKSKGKSFSINGSKITITDLNVNDQNLVVDANKIEVGNNGDHIKSVKSDKYAEVSGWTENDGEIMAALTP